jgi:hypothetical protein
MKSCATSAPETKKCLVVGGGLNMELHDQPGTCATAKREERERYFPKKPNRQRVCRTRLRFICIKPILQQAGVLSYAKEKLASLSRTFRILFITPLRGPISLVISLRASISGFLSARVAITLKRNTAAKTAKPIISLGQLLTFKNETAKYATAPDAADETSILADETQSTLAS